MTLASGSDDPPMETPNPTSRRETSPTTPRTVIVTGAGTGIGRATAHAFADEGAHVVTSSYVPTRRGGRGRRSTPRPRASPPR
ncbi:SDR family oxidoreductase [Streptomyces cellulosae]